MRTVVAVAAVFVAAAVALFSLTLVDEHVLGKVDNISCVATPLAATAAMMFSSSGAPDAKSIVGYGDFRFLLLEYQLYSSSCFSLTPH